MTAHDALGPQFTIEHKTVADADDPETHHGTLRAVDPKGGTVGLLAYSVRPQLDDYNYPKPGTREVSGINRETEAPFQRQGVQTQLQDKLHELHPGVPVVSYSDDMSTDAVRFRKTYMHRSRTEVNWQRKPGTRW